jgi:mannose-1-phosphate guanylyltransferase
MLHLVIMAGGSGTRFWPESRRAKPKQFLALTGERTLLQQAADRCRPWIPTERMHVVTGAAYAAETRRQLPDLPPRHVLQEPCGRNTAPCIALAALHVSALDPDATILVTPADHLIRPESEFRATVERAVALLHDHPQSSVLMGIRPTHPATGYGYIERASPGADNLGTAFAVESFREKPAREVARQFLQAGSYFWNAGIFLWRAAGILQLIRDFQPEIHERLLRLRDCLGTPEWEAALAAEFPGMPSISIDYGVLEPMATLRDGKRPVFVVPASFEWDDVGSWEALPRVLGADHEENTISGPQCGLETAGCVIRTTPDHLVATFGISDLIVVHTPEATLIAPRDDESAIRKLVARLEENGYGRFL